MDNKKILFFMIDKLSDKRGGLTKALLDRANYLAESQEVHLLVTEFQDNFEIILDDLIKLNRINKKIKVRNFFYELLDGYNEDSECILNLLNSNIRNEKNLYQNKDDFLREFLEDGTYKTYTKYLNKNSKQIIFIDNMNYFDFNMRETRKLFYKGKFFALKKYINNKVSQFIIYKNNLPKFLLWYKEDKLYKCFYVLENSREIDIFNLQDKLNDWFLKNIHKNDIIFLDQAFKRFENVLSKLECEKIGIVHNHHKLNGEAGYLIKSKQYDKYVFLTELQKNDVSQEYEHILSKSYVIPHAYSKLENINIRERKNRIVTISRLSLSQKKILEGIQAFSKIHKKFPHIIYEIYGVGDGEEKIRSLIKELDLQKKVLLNGYTNNSLEIFSSSLMSINLSSYEGFGLSLIESISMGCPVIASNVDYGPKEIVKNNINGFLVDNSDIEDIASKMEYILNNFEVLQKKCHSSIEEFSPVRWKNNINNLIK